MEQRNDRPNRWQELGQRVHYWEMRSKSLQAILFVWMWDVLLCLDYFFLFPRLEIAFARMIGGLTMVAGLLCSFLYLNHGYRRLKRQ